MKKIVLKFAVSAVALLVLLGGATALHAERLVILHTNDTHSNIDIADDGTGGVLPRLAIIDSVRNAEKNVLLIDAGDGVQGTLYFKFFKGDVEYPLFNMMDYDVRILGNHEFDNGLDDLARYWKTVKADRLSANYDFTGTPAEGLFVPYTIRRVGDSKVGIMGLNIDPASLIAEENYEGMKYADIIDTANRTAAELKKKGCDLVIAVTHIGYEVSNGKTDDRALAQASKDIDIIIGGHSHTFVDPSTPDRTPYWFRNSEGRDVLITQTGRHGKNVGFIALDTKNHQDRHIEYKYIPVTDRFKPEEYSAEIQVFLAPYKHVVDSVNRHVIGWAPAAMDNGNNSAYANWTGDFGAWYGRQIADSLRRAGVDVPPVALGIMNVGGIRHPAPAGVVTEGQILSTFPFSNRMRLIEIAGRDLIETMKIVAPRGGEAVSAEVRVVTDSAGNFRNMSIDGVPVDPDKMYVVSTIDYVANGNDDMTPMKRHREIWRDDKEVSVRILEYVYLLTAQGLPVEADPTPRFTVSVTELLP